MMVGNGDDDDDNDVENQTNVVSCAVWYGRQQVHVRYIGVEIFYDTHTNNGTRRLASSVTKGNTPLTMTMTRSVDL